MGSGVFTAFSLTVPKTAVAEFRKLPIVLPRSWPADLTTNTRYLPSSDGVLPREGEDDGVETMTAETLLARLPVGHSVTNGGSIEIDGYLPSYDEFFRWFDAIAFLCVGVARLGGSGSGAFFWDSECPEPVLFELEVADGKVKVLSDDPQNNQRMLERWEPRFQAWSKRRGA